MQLSVRPHFELRVEPLEVDVVIGPTAIASIELRGSASLVSHYAKRAAKTGFVVAQTYDEAGLDDSEKHLMHAPAGLQRFFVQFLSCNFVDVSCFDKQHIRGNDLSGIPAELLDDLNRM